MPFWTQLIDILRAPTGIGFAGGKGATREEAIVIRGAHTNQEGLRAEHAYLDRTYGRTRWFLYNQRLVREEDRWYDQVRIQLTDGRFVDLWFDITAFHGPW